MLRWTTRFGLRLGIPCREYVAYNPAPLLQELKEMSFRDRLRKLPVDTKILQRLQGLKLGRTRDRALKGDTRQSVQSRRQQQAQVVKIKPRLQVTCTDTNDFPREAVGSEELAFVGRSNVGKSSLLNVLAGTSIVASISDRPGETQSINFYNMPRGFPRLVDMPGYGFAFSAEHKKLAWTKAMNEYLEKRNSLSRVCVLIDSRHGMKELDLELCRMLNDFRRRFMVVLTKGDLVEQKMLAKIVWYTKEHLNEFDFSANDVSVLSSKTRAGVPELQQMVFPTLREGRSSTLQSVETMRRVVHQSKRSGSSRKGTRAKNDRRAKYF